MKMNIGVKIKNSLLCFYFRCGSPEPEALEPAVIPATSQVGNRCFVAARNRKPWRLEPDVIPAASQVAKDGSISGAAAEKLKLWSHLSSQLRHR
jgi:hypothetical protein